MRRRLAIKTIIQTTRPSHFRNQPFSPPPATGLAASLQVTFTFVIALTTGGVLAGAAVEVESPTEPIAQFRVVEGYNIYAPLIVQPAGESRRLLYFGGWLTRRDFPHDAIYECDIGPTVDHAPTCSGPHAVITSEALSSPAMHINNPSIRYIPQLGLYAVAATVCADSCQNPRDSQVWIGTTVSLTTPWKLKMLLDQGAAEPTFGEISESGDRVTLVYSRRGDMSHLYGLALEPLTSTPIGSPFVYLTDPGRYALTNPSYSEIGDYRLLLWNRLTGDFDPSLGRAAATGVDVAMAVAKKGGAWQQRGVLLQQNTDICAYLTPSSVANRDDTISVLVGLVKRAGDKWCRLAGKSSEIDQFIYRKDQLLLGTDR